MSKGVIIVAVSREPSSISVVCTPAVGDSAMRNWSWDITARSTVRQFFNDVSSDPGLYVEGLGTGTQAAEPGFPLQTRISGQRMNVIGLRFGLTSILRGCGCTTAKRRFVVSVRYVNRPEVRIGVYE